MALNPSGEAVPRSHRGASRLGCLLGLLVLGLGVYAGFLVLGGELDYRALLETASREARFAETKTDEEIRRAVLDEADDLGLPPAARDVRVRRLGPGRVEVHLAYPDTIRFFGRWEWVRLRQVSVRGP